MPNFDYIASADLRASLESDYAEMQKCAQSGAWKSSQVLAGSIVECLLIDYLTSSTHPSRPAKDPLKIDLAEAIAICRTEKAVSDRTADLCSVIRSYRNLIHPGRVLRLQEPPPNKTTSDIAVGLIDLIVDEIARTRRAAVGLTAAQIISKVLRDEGAMTILKHLLSETTEQQREVLLLKLLPEAYRESLAIDDPFDTTSQRLADAFRVALEGAAAETRKKLTREFVRVVREEDGGWVDTYRNAFFRSSDIAYVDSSSSAMLKAHLLGSVTGIHSVASMRVVEDLCAHIEPDDCAKWIDPLVRTITAASAVPPLRKRAREAITNAPLFTTKAFDEKVRSRLTDWIKHYEKQGHADSVQSLQALLKEFELLSPP